MKDYIEITIVCFKKEGDTLEKRKKIMLYSIVTSFLFTAPLAYKENKSNLYKKELENHANLCRDLQYQIIAHRGFSSIGIENTKSAFIPCNYINCVDGVEIDIHLTKDGVPILFHNDKIEEKRINTLTLKQIEKYSITKSFCLKDYLETYKEEIGYSKRKRAIKLEKKEEKIITLKEALNIINSTKTLLVDMKFEKEKIRNEIMIKEVSNCLKNSDFSNIIIQSTDAITLQKMQKIAPFFSYQLIINKSKNIKEYYNYFDSFAIKEELVTKEIIHKLHENNKKISIWTINNCETLLKLITKIHPYEKEVSYITDYPDIICYTLQSNKKQIKK